ncbi:MAG TPA: hypothetical protein ENK88_07290, partial [Campylobacterales bacterium]|nr:hypothetical protein [Campylobacterales bacterium]
MVEEVSIVATITAVLGALASYLFVKNDNKKQFKHYVTEAKAKASAIAYEAEHILQEAQIEIKSKEVELDKRFQDKVLEVEKQKTELLLELKSLEEKKQEFSLIKKELEKK